ncbi:MAG: antibiotic biosynthesis monooxygenase [Proteobacteria bacterium]|nr:antibiotic biosynthesis monooxygenase [Pseudomonadota bacterium]
MPRFALVVKLKLKPGSSETFIPLIKENQRLSLANEEGCRNFIVMKNLEEEDTYHFYEEYDSLEAFKIHQNSDHFKRYFAVAKDLMVERLWHRSEVVE